MKFISLIILIFSSISLFSQDYELSYYTGSLEASIIYAKTIVKDDNGYVYVGSDRGITRFDGSKFKNYSEGLQNISIKWMIRTKDKRILVASDGGVDEMITDSGQVRFKPVIRMTDEPESYFKRFISQSISLLMKHLKNEAKVEALYPKQIFEDSNGCLWVSGWDKVVAYKDGKINTYPLAMKYRYSSFFRSFHILENRPNEILLFGYNGELTAFDSENQQFNDIASLPIHSKITDVIRASVDTFLIGTFDGVFELVTDGTKYKTCKKLANVSEIGCIAKLYNYFIIGTKGKVAYRLQKINSNYELTPLKDNFKNINNFYFDGTILWLASEDGFWKLKPTFFSATGNQNFEFGTYPKVHEAPDKQLYFTSKGSLFKISEQDNIIATERLLSSPGQILFITSYKSDILYLAGAPSGGKPTMGFISDKQIIELPEKLAEPFYGICGNNDDVWICQENSKGVTHVSKDFKIREYQVGNGHITVMRYDKTGKLLAFNGEGVEFMYEYDNKADTFVSSGYKFDVAPKTQIVTRDALVDAANRIYIGTNVGLFLHSNGKTERVPLGNYTNTFVKALAFDKDSALWLGTEEGILKKMDDAIMCFNTSNGLFSNSIYYKGIGVDSHNRIWLSTINGICISRNNGIPKETQTPMILKITVNDSVEFNRNQILKGAYIKFNYLCVAPGERIEYQYRISDLAPLWSESSNEPSLFIPNIKVGNYKVEIRSRIDGNYRWSKPISYTFTVIYPWYQRWWAFVLYLITATFLVFVIIKLYSRRLIRQKEILEDIVKERTAEINQQKEEIFAQAENLEHANYEITIQKEKLEHSHTEITSSISYASRIQLAVMPKTDLLASIFPKHFVFYKPRDIISGDFYFVRQIDNFVLLAVADCTGHGVPGAFMSMLGITLLNELVQKPEITSSSMVLNELRKNIKAALQQTGEKGEQQDGMDIAFCSINMNDLTLCFAGAYNPLWIFRNSMANDLPSENLVQDTEFTIIEADHMPVGVYTREEPFTERRFQLQKGDTLYMFSDGFSSQFGGPKNEKYKTARMKAFFAQLYNNDMNEQGKLIENEFNSWKMDYKQTDDVLVLGVTI